MRSITTRALLLLSCLILAGVVPQLLAKKKVRPPDTPIEQKRAAHALNRLTFGPRPGDVEQVMAVGVDRWIDLELHPEKIADNNLESRLTPLRTLHMRGRRRRCGHARTGGVRRRRVRTTTGMVAMLSEGDR